MCNAGYRDASRLGRVLSGAAGAGSTTRRRNNLDIYPGLLVFSAERRAPSAQGARATLVTRYPREPWEPPEPSPSDASSFVVGGWWGGRLSGKM
jgi:hypothetical protein